MDSSLLSLLDEWILELFVPFDPEDANVIIVTDDGWRFKVHRRVLERHSAFFRGLFGPIRPRRKILYRCLETKGPLIKAMVEFMYSGKCLVAKEDLERFFHLGKLFGLAEV